jgi:precorrin-6Y C5,15-methyltransferase (decarboxylating)
LFGNPDDAFLQSKPQLGLLTPAEVRAMALAQLDIAPSSTVWDVGAGSGSVSIEAAQMASDGSVYAVEMDADEHSLIRENAERFGVANVNAVLGRAPEAFEELPDPDAVFIAGAGREVIRLTEAAYLRLRRGGRLVVNTTSIDHLSELRQLLSRHSSQLHVWMINLARGTDQLDRLTFEPLKPSFLLAVTKG